MTWAIVEVQDGVVSVDAGADVQYVIVDWDMIRDDRDYALLKLRQVATTREIPPQPARQVSEEIRRVWSDKGEPL